MPCTYTHTDTQRNLTLLCSVFHHALLQRGRRSVFMCVHVCVCLCVMVNALTVRRQEDDSPAEGRDIIKAWTETDRRLMCRTFEITHHTSGFSPHPFLLFYLVIFYTNLAICDHGLNSCSKNSCPRQKEVSDSTSCSRGR